MGKKAKPKIYMEPLGPCVNCGSTSILGGSCQECCCAQPHPWVRQRLQGAAMVASQAMAKASMLFDVVTAMQARIDALEARETPQQWWDRKGAAAVWDSPVPADGNAVDAAEKAQRCVDMQKAATAEGEER
jgi:hypothetical protein